MRYLCEYSGHKHIPGRQYIRDVRFQVLESLIIQGCKFSDFSLISNFSLSTPLKISFESLSLEHVSYDFIIGSDFRKGFVIT